jgi:hypothetical protein
MGESYGSGSGGLQYCIHYRLTIAYPANSNIMIGRSRDNSNVRPLP